jgi:hypothetical protein
MGDGSKKVEAVVFFAEPFTFTPKVAVRTIELLGNHSLDIEFVAGQPEPQPAAFAVDILASNPVPEDETLRVTYDASFQGPCASHDHCPASGYCDMYLGCDDCAVCNAIGDTFDGNLCPDRCRKWPSHRG